MNPKQSGILSKYELVVRDIPVTVMIVKNPNSFTLRYGISISGISKTTEIILEEIQEDLISLMQLKKIEVDEKTGQVEETFNIKAQQLLEEFFPYSSEEVRTILKSYLISRSIGMGYVDFLLKDPHLEEITIDNSKKPLWVYHKQWGWLETNIYMTSEDQILQTAARIGRNVGRQINVLNPILDAYLSTGERVNATISPITPEGNTITLRKFSDDPWTISKFIDNKTISPEAAAFIWMAIEYEMSMLVIGGTASGKTSMLNAIANFIPPNQRIVTIEDTRELKLASFLYAVPMITRLPNAEGKGEVRMQDLMVNSLRMRPDRILVGEVRRRQEAQTMFEAIHTGHSCYGTFHANQAEEAIKRLVNEPIEIPSTLLPAMNIVVTQFRNRRTGKRRTLEICEVTKEGGLRRIYKFDHKKDRLVKENEPKRVIEELELFTAMDKADILKDLKEREKLLNSFVQRKLFNVDELGREIADFYVAKSEFSGD